MRRTLAAITALISALAIPAAAVAAVPDRYILPGDAVFPEGVATRPGTDEFYVTSTSDGTVFRGRLGQERTSVFLPARRDGRVNAVGIRATRDRLVVAGGTTGRVFVYDLSTRRLVRRFSRPARVASSTTSPSRRRATCTSPIPRAACSSVSRRAISSGGAQASCG